MNNYLFPLYDSTLTWTREISTGASGLTLIALALVATWKPRVLQEKIYLFGMLAFLAIGIIALGFGLSTQSTPLVALGASLNAIGRGFATVLIGIACIRLPLRTMGLCVAGASLLAYAIRSIFLLLPSFVGVAFFALIPFVIVVLIWQFAQPILRHAAQTDPPAQMALTQPSSYLPFAHQFFVCLLLFRIAYGYALTLGEIDGVPLSTTLALIPLVLVVFFAWRSKKALNPDILFQASFLFVIAGFLLVPIADIGKNAAVNTLLSAGVGCFEILFWFVLIALGSKNETGAISVFAWGSAMNSFGVIIGANFGRFTNAHYDINSTTVALIAALMVLLFVAYMVIFLKKFSFRKTIESIEPDHIPVAPTDATLLEIQCARVSTEYGLTTREREVFALLARGRNGRFIQEELVISYNTVKAHIKHIYAKLDIHTQQELIDLIENNPEQPSYNKEK